MIGDAPHASRPRGTPLPSQDGARGVPGTRSRDGWASWRALRATWGRFPEDWRATPAAARRRWARALAAGFAITAATTAGLLAAARTLEARGLAAWDDRALRWVVEGDPFSVAYAIWFETWGNDAFIVPVLLAGLYAALSAGRPLRALTLLAGYLGAKVFIVAPWLVWARARPTLVADGVASPGFHAFPSGHAVNVVVVLGLLAAWWMRASRSGVERVVVGAGYLAVLAAVNLARLRLGTHWPSDTIAGAVIGTVWLAALLRALRGAEADGALRGAESATGRG